MMTASLAAAMMTESGIEILTDGVTEIVKEPENTEKGELIQQLSFHPPFISFQYFFLTLDLEITNYRVKTKMIGVLATRNNLRV